MGETGVQCQDECRLKSRVASETDQHTHSERSTNKEMKPFPRLAQLVTRELNQPKDNRVLLEAKFILSVLAWAVHLALSYPERPA